MAKLNHGLFKQACRYMVGGVSSPVRSFRYIGGEPLLIKSGKGSKVFDHDGRRYIDYVLSWGSLILGHAYPQVLRDIKKTMGQGLSFGTTNAREIELAARIQNAIPFIEKVRFVNSGTEAVMGAVRLARGVTKRDKILKFENAYHGHADYLLTKAGSGLSTFGLPTSAGVPKDFTRHTLVVPLGDLAAIDKIFKKYAGQIAAVLAEPVGGNFGLIAPDIDFLKRLRAITKRSGSLLIFDEVITGFRFHFGSFAGISGVTPDIITLGKIIGGGLPIGAYGASKKIMDHLAPNGKVYQASTFAGNPVVMRAGLGTLEILEKKQAYYRRIDVLAGILTTGLLKIAQQRGVDINIVRFGSMFSLRFTNKGRFRSFYRRMLAQGVFFAPSEFEVNFLSFVHTHKDIEQTLKAASKALGGSI
ncbi:MAG: glutamate-1-semialdehyde 2,1-aminomutase [Candidatus Omnitrophica bacterium]|nr:glutamate-1-semialdehyde 2,1-aminomutase [Candidatus Omnitrophota bacterium]